MKSTLQRWSLAASAASITAMVKISSAFAQTGFAGQDPTIPGTPAAGTGAQAYRDIIIKVLTAVLNFLALIAVIVVVIAGIRLIVSQGEEETKEKAKKTIFYALMGLVIVLFARVIVGLITNYLSGAVATSA
jgi:hypothetical protein